MKGTDMQICSSALDVLNAALQLVTALLLLASRRA